MEETTNWCYCCKSSEHLIYDYNTLVEESWMTAQDTFWNSTYQLNNTVPPLSNQKWGARRKEGIIHFINQNSASQSWKVKNCLWSIIQWCGIENISWVTMEREQIYGPSSIRASRWILSLPTIQRQGNLKCIPFQILKRTLHTIGVGGSTVWP